MSYAKPTAARFPFVLSVALLLIPAAVTGPCRAADRAARHASAETARRRTIVTPHLAAPIEPGRNTIFCSTFQLAWNRMRSEILGEEILLEGRPDLASRLNGGLASEEDISEDDYLALVGYGSRGIAGEINRALREKFGEAAPQLGERFDGDDVILAYAFLMKEMHFENPFEDFAHPLEFTEADHSFLVEAFGIFHYDDARHGMLRDQVEVIDYRSSRDFIIRLLPAGAEDEIIIARTSPGATLGDTYEAVSGRITRSRRARIGSEDILMIPKIDFSIERVYSELLGLHLMNEGWTDYFVAAAEQDILFRLDESGASMRSEGIFAIKKGPAPDFRMLVCNGPFLLCCRRVGADAPYLALWVGNADLLVRSE